MLLAAWGLDPDYILDHWTDELLDLMIDNLINRLKPEGTKPPLSPDTEEVPAEELFARMGIKVKH